MGELDGDESVEDDLGGDQQVVVAVLKRLQCGEGWPYRELTRSCKYQKTFPGQFRAIVAQPSVTASGGDMLDEM